MNQTRVPPRARRLYNGLRPDAGKKATKKKPPKKPLCLKTQEPPREPSSETKRRSQIGIKVPTPQLPAWFGTDYQAFLGSSHNLLAPQ